MSIFKNILVPIDFSSCSLDALKYAISVAEKFKARITIVHIYPIPAVGDTTFFMDKSMLDTIEKRVRIEFKVIEHYNKELKKMRVEYVVKMGFVVNDMLEVIGEQKIDLVVMGTKGTSNRLQDIFGSTTVEVIQKAACPVLVIPEKTKNQEIRKVAFAANFQQKNIDEPLKKAKQVANQYGAQMKIVHVGKGEMSQEEISKRNEILATVEKGIKTIENTYDYIHDSDVVEGIENYIESERIDLIVLTPHKYNLLERIFKESVTRTLTLHSQIPLLAIPE